MHVQLLGLGDRPSAPPGLLSFLSSAPDLSLSGPGAARIRRAL
eukprot:CAMPEP_0194282100 /NCGR_PEP_ID=MMETSP0169-20130528/22367_1 /TAXON_ID=218684 /ORGANISM="Corethron pennatum, Strain L29A3" /LENGTH=42 /DNA_ID= /DNA_START= /DNA_END= /DNA_ORIENTATION=